jgi:allantoin racemase
MSGGTQRNRLLIVNPNLNKDVTRWVSDEARRAANGRFEVLAVNAESGLYAIEAPADIERAAAAVAATLQDHAPIAGAVIAAFGDPGLVKARAHFSKPLVGLGEAGLRAAARNGRRFAIVTLGAAMRRSIEEKVASLGLSRQLAEIRILPVSISAAVADRSELEHMVGKEIAQLAGLAEAVLLGGAPFAGMAVGLTRQAAFPVLDGVADAVAAVERSWEG